MQEQRCNSADLVQKCNPIFHSRAAPTPPSGSALPAQAATLADHCWASCDHKEAKVETADDDQN